MRCPGNAFACAGFGTPNRRKRVFVVASLHGDARDVLLSQVPLITIKYRQKVTVEHNIYLQSCRTHVTQCQVFQRNMLWTRSCSLRISNAISVALCALLSPATLARAVICDDPLPSDGSP